MNHLAHERRVEALAMFKREVNEVFSLLGLAVGEHALGHRPEAEAALRELIERHSDGAAFQVAGACACLGDADQAFHWLQQADAQRRKIETTSEIGCATSHVRPALDGIPENMGLGHIANSRNGTVGRSASILGRSYMNERWHFEQGTRSHDRLRQS
jgi:hypothetical protein